MSTNTYATEYIGSDGQGRVLTDGGEFAADIETLMRETTDTTSLALYRPSGDGVTIDQDTGEVIQDGPMTFRNIVDAESYIFGLAEGEESLKLRQVRALMAIRDQKLYREKPDPEFADGRPFKTFDRYLKDLVADLITFSGDKKRTIEDYMRKIRLYQEQLGKSDEWFLEMGYHATLMLQLAAVERKSKDILPDDEPVIINGQEVGKRLGLVSFKAFVDETERLVRAQATTTFDTKRRVREVLGKETREAKWSIEAKEVGGEIVITRITLWIDDVGYAIGDRIPADEFVLGAGSMEVSGLGDGWKERLVN